MSQAMFSFHRRINKNEQIVGWYATTNNGIAITEYSSLIHEFYSGQCQNPIHIVVDTSLSTPSLNVRGFVCQPIVLDGHVLASTFDEIPVSTECSVGEQVALHQMIYNQVSHKSDSSTLQPFQDTTIYSTLPSAKQTMKSSLEKLNKLLLDIQVHVDRRAAPF